MIDEPFLLVESDVVFDEQLLAPLLLPDRIAVSRQLPWMSGTTVTLDGEGKVNAFYTQPPLVIRTALPDVGAVSSIMIWSLSLSPPPTTLPAAHMVMTTFPFAWPAS